MAEDSYPSSISDEALIRDVLSGGKDRYRLLIARYRQMVFGMIMRQTGDSQTAEELTHECFVKAYLNLSSFRNEAKFSTWLVRIALNLTNSWFSSARYKEKYLTESFDPAIHDTTTPGPEKEKEKKEALLEFRRAVAALKPKFRDVVVMCGFEGKSYEEAAGILKVPVGTVRSRLNTARLQLKQTLSGGFLRSFAHES